MMLLTGDIGATTTRLALVSADAGPRKFVAEQEFRSVDFEGLQPIVKAFLASSGERPTSACFDVAGPVIAGHAHLTNLPWDLEEAALCRDLDLDHITLLNDLEAIADAVPHLQLGETAEVNAGRAVEHAPIAVLAPGTGLGEAFMRAFTARAASPISCAIPVHVITINAALLGAALYGLNHAAAGRLPSIRGHLEKPKSDH